MKNRERRGGIRTLLRPPARKYAAKHLLVALAGLAATMAAKSMADWRQIQARIRKAKTSSDPPAQLAELYERTRDAMVAFELAQWHEKAGNASETVQWYTTAA